MGRDPPNQYPYLPTPIRPSFFDGLGYAHAQQRPPEIVPRARRASNSLLARTRGVAVLGFVAVLTSRLCGCGRIDLNFLNPFVFFKKYAWICCICLIITAVVVVIVMVQG